MFGAPLPVQPEEPIPLVYANPPDACSPLVGSHYAGETGNPLVFLGERIGFHDNHFCLS